MTPPKAARKWIKLLKPRTNSALWMLLSVFLILAGLAYTGYLQISREYLSKEPFIFNIGNYKSSVYQLLENLMIVVLLFWSAATISGIGENHIGNIRKLRSSTRSLFVKLFQIAVYVVAFMVGLDVIGIQLTALAVFSGALGIGIGFGLQKITSNFISGIILLLEKTIEVDNMLEFQDGTTGFVRRMNTRFTLVEMYDGKEVFIPNEEFITTRVINWTYSNSKARVDMEINVAYGSDLRKVQSLILQAAETHPRALKDPAPSCHLTGFGENAVTFKLFFWVKDVTEGRLGPKSDVLFTIHEAFQANNIRIPFPSREVWIHSEKKEEAE